MVLFFAVSCTEKINDIDNAVNEDDANEIIEEVSEEIYLVMNSTFVFLSSHSSNYEDFEFAPDNYRRDSSFIFTEDYLFPFTIHPNDTSFF